MKRPSSTLTNTEAHALLGAATDGRDRAMIVLLWRGGLRVAEACAVDILDLEPLACGGLKVHIRCGKGGKARFVGLDGRARAILEDHIGARRDGPVLRTRNGIWLSTSHVRRTLARLAQTAGIHKRVHPHALRHTFAREMHDEGVGIRALQVALGHSSLATTQTYLQSIGCDEAVKITAGRTW